MSQKLPGTAHDHFLEPEVAAVLETERKVFAEARSTEAHREALRAFRERRAPRFH